MKVPKELKYYVTTEKKEKYEMLNEKIINISKIYFNLVNNYSYELNQLEITLSSLNNTEQIKIKQLLENQQILINDLVQMINELLMDLKFKESKLQKLKKNERDCRLTENKIESYLKIEDRNNNSHVNTLDTNSSRKNKSDFTKRIKTYDSKNKEIKNEQIPVNIVAPKSNNEFNGTMSFLNISLPDKKKNVYEGYINKKYKNKSNSYCRLEKIVKDKTHKVFPKSSSTPAVGKNSLITNLKINQKKKSSPNQNKLSHTKSNINSIVNYLGNTSMFTPNHKKNLNLKEKNSIKKCYKNNSYEKISIPSNLTPYNDRNINMEEFDLIRNSNGSFSFMKNGQNEQIIIEPIYVNSKGDTRYSYSKMSIKPLITPTRLTNNIYCSSYNILNNYEKKSKKNCSVPKYKKEKLDF